MKKFIVCQKYINQKKSAVIIGRMYTSQGYSPEEIAELTGLTITEVLIQLKLYKFKLIF
ncbi:hypothetical protein P4283_28400 [Bacillus thuringiensis]|nr:hypothetical protein [Bacillus thuringiensis]